jgi:hypothetical protein
VSVLAETLLERTLDADAINDDADPGILGRVGCWVADGVTSLTCVALVRLRHQLSTQRGSASGTTLVEEANALAWIGADRVVEGSDALQLLQPPPLADPPQSVRDRFVAQAIQQMEKRISELNNFAERRAQALLADHRRVREAADARGSYSVRSLLPVDIIGVFVLLPKVN